MDMWTNSQPWGDGGKECDLHFLTSLSLIIFSIEKVIILLQQSTRRQFAAKYYHHCELLKL